MVSKDAPQNQETRERDIASTRVSLHPTQLSCCRQSPVEGLLMRTCVAYIYRAISTRITIYQGLVPWEIGKAPQKHGMPVGRAARNR